MGCVNDIASALARRAQKFLHGSVEDVIAFRHPYGCSQMGDDQENTRRLLADLIRHPNAGGVLVLGLGCENSGVDALRPYLGEEPLPRVRTLVCQEVEDELAAGEALLRELIDQAAPWERVPVSTEKLVIGLKCGGSDGFSGITANPTIGAFSDRLIARGGTTILTEVPEMFGAETLLMDRCESEAVFRQTVSLINDFKHYFTANHQTVYENPSPGNKKGGITTLEDKSLGCTQKSGSAPVVDVLPYAHRVEKPGLNLLSAPGNDLVAATALAAAGAQIVLFSTGRGTPFACPVPTVKIASNPTLAQRKRNWIDFSAAPALEGVSIEQLGEALYRKVLAVAGGEPVKSEEAGFHDLAIFKQGLRCNLSPFATEKPRRLAWRLEHCQPAGFFFSRLAFKVAFIRRRFQSQQLANGDAGIVLLKSWNELLQAAHVLCVGMVEQNAAIFHVLHRLIRVRLAHIPADCMEIPGLGNGVDHPAVALMVRILG